MPFFHTYRPGLLPYLEGLAMQERFLDQHRPGDPDLLILLRHPAVVTLGRRSGPDSLRLSTEQLQLGFGIETYQVGRGGEATFHGPAQLVGYPLVDLNQRGRDLHRFVFLLEQTLLDTLCSFGVEGKRIKGRTGVWIKEEKIASIGIGIRHWMSWHGFSLNVGTDLEGFKHIVPCGMPDVSMTSLAHQLKQEVSMAEVEEKLVTCFSRNFDTCHLGEYAPFWTTQT